MRTCQTLAFLLFAASSMTAALFKQWPLGLLAAGAAVSLVPAVFDVV